MRIVRISRGSDRPSRVSAAARGAHATEVFDAFISYSQKADRRLADSLQRALQRFAKPWYRRRALRVFRDDANLAAAPELWDSIERSLEGSRHLILLASREGAASPWVAREVEWWRHHKPTDRLLVALTDGEPRWEGPDAALPGALAGAFEEPRHVDLRWARDEEQLSSGDPRFLDAVADLAAALHGRPKDDLIGEDVREHRRVVWLARTAVALLALLAALATAGALVALDQRNTAREQRARATEQAELATSRQLVAEATLRARREPDLALLLALAAADLRASPETHRALVTQASRWELAERIFTARREHVRGTSPVVNALSWAGPDRLAAAGKAGLQVRKLRRGAAPIREVDVPLQAVAYAAGGRWAAVGARGVYLLDLRGQGRQIPVNSHVAVSGLALGPRGNPLVAWTNRGIVVWRIERGDPRAVARLRGDAFALSPDGRTLALGRSGHVDLWDVRRRRLRARLPTGTGAFVDLALSEDALLAVSEDGRLAFWDTREERRLSSVRAHGPLAFNPDGSVLASTDGDSRVVLWKGLERQVLDGHAAPITALAYAPGGRRLASADEGGRAVVWKPRRSELTTPGVWKALGTLDDGRPYAIDEDDSTLGVWHAETGRALGAVKLRDIDPDVAALSPNGHRLAFSAGPRTFVGDPSEAGGEYRLLRGTGSDVMALAFAPRGGRLAGAFEDGRVRMWDPDRGSVTTTVKAHRIGLWTLRFSPDGRRLGVAGGAGHLSLWRVGSRLKRQATLRGHANIVTSLAFTQGGRRLASGTDDGDVRVWDLGREEELQTLRGSDSFVNALAFSPDGRLLASGGDEDAVRLWDPRAGVSLGIFRLDNFVTHLDFAPGAPARLRFTAFGGRLSSIELDPAALRRRLCALPDRTLTRREWRAFMPGRPYRPPCKRPLDPR
jgi:WD40 repeat protein